MNPRWTVYWHSPYDNNLGQDVVMASIKRIWIDKGTIVRRQYYGLTWNSIEEAQNKADELNILLDIRDTIEDNLGE